VDRYAMSITSTLIDGADIRFREAADVLRPYVGCFWVITAQRGATIRVVPDGSTAISIRIENGRCSGWLLRGPLVEPDERCYAAPATLVGVRLRPGVAVLVSGIAADRTLGRRIELAGIAPSAGAEHDAPWTPAQYIDTLERFLIDRIGNARVPDIVSRAIQEIEREHGSLRVSALAERCGVSPRHLNRLMRGWVGLRPEVLCPHRQISDDAAPDRGTRPPNRAPHSHRTRDISTKAHLTLDVTRLAGATPRHLASHSVSDFSKTRCDDLP
jgi:hypothetical protein